MLVIKKELAPSDVGYYKNHINRHLCKSWFLPLTIGIKKLLNIEAQKTHRQYNEYSIMHFSALLLTMPPYNVEKAYLLNRVLFCHRNYKELINYECT